MENTTPKNATPNLDISYVAHLARIALSKEEIALFQSQLGRVLEYVEKLKEVDVSQVEPMAHTTPVYNVFRKDEVREGLAKSVLLANAPHSANGLFMITKVVE